jgi:muramoyltetrapeptide carboxypeptidase LdcA involved in peptidoglycan recycling
MNPLIKPPRLHPGDKVAAVTLSWGGPAVFPGRYQAGKRQLEEAFGVQVVEMPHTLSEAGWLKAHPQARADDLLQAFANPEIKAIVSTIGGEDSIRLLPYLDLDVIRNNPKIFLGYSDTTVTHFACRKAGIGSFYGPSIMAGFGENGGLFSYMVDSVRKTLFSCEPIGVLVPNTQGWTDERLDWSIPKNQAIKRKLQPCSGWNFLQGAGIHTGRLLGGCIEVLDWLRGTCVWPEDSEWDDAVLFLETSEDGPSPLAVARLLRALAAQGVLKRISGLLFGRPGGEVGAEHFAEYDQAILEICVGEEGLIELPIVTNMDFGHTDPMLVLPIGAQVRIDCARRELAITESAVAEK